MLRLRFIVTITILLQGMLYAQVSNADFFRARGVSNFDLHWGIKKYNWTTYDLYQMRQDILYIESDLSEKITFDDENDLEKLRKLEMARWLKLLKKKSLNISFTWYSSMLKVRGLEKDLETNVAKLEMFKKVLKADEFEHFDVHIFIPKISLSDLRLLHRAGMKNVKMGYLRKIHNIQTEVKEELEDESITVPISFYMYLRLISNSNFDWTKLKPIYLASMYVRQLLWFNDSHEYENTITFFNKSLMKKVCGKSLNGILNAVYEKNKAISLFSNKRFIIPRFLKDPALYHILEVYQKLSPKLQKTEMALYVGRYLYANKIPVSRYQEIVTLVQMKRAINSHIEIFGPGKDVILISNNERSGVVSGFRFGSEGLRKEIKKVTNKAPYLIRNKKYPDNQDRKLHRMKIIATLVHSPPGTVFILDGHGSMSGFWVEGGLSIFSDSADKEDICFTPKVMCEIMNQRYILHKNKGKKDVWIFATCVSQNIYRDTWGKVPHYEGVIICFSEYGQYSYTTYGEKTRSKLVTHLLKCKTLGKLCELSDEGHHSNLSIFLGTLQIK